MKILVVIIDSKYGRSVHTVKTQKQVNKIKKETLEAFNCKTVDELTSIDVYFSVDECEATNE